MPNSNSVPIIRCCRVKADGIAKARRGSSEEIKFHRDYDSPALPGWPCHASIFRFCSDNKGREITIDYSFKIKTESDGVYNDVLLLQPKEVTKVIKLIKEIVPFNYKTHNAVEREIVNENEVDVKYLYINTKVTGNQLAHKCFMMLMRILWEFPHNLAAVDAINMKKKFHVKDGINFNKISFLNLYLMCLSSNWRFSSDESLVYNFNFVPKTIKQLKEVISKNRHNRISRIYDYGGGSPCNVISRFKEISAIRDSRNFNDRVTKYIANIKKANENIRSMGAHWG